MSTATSQRVIDCYQFACNMDVQAFKPGNVSIHAAGHGMTAGQFLRSAAFSAPEIARSNTTLGQRILDTVAATQAAVGCNTNLGIVLLVAPLAHAHLMYPSRDLAESTRRVLAQTTVEDADAVYSAIRLALPGGLGRVERHDVFERPHADLTESMRAAAAHDLIARQYANGFADLFGDALPYLADATRRHSRPESALTDLFLHFLSTHLDTHIRRKFGEGTATDISALAQSVHDEWRGSCEDDAHRCLTQFDASLKRRGINPGTSADFCVAAAFLHRLQLQTGIQPGPVPDNPRNLTPNRGTVPQLTSSQ